MTRNRVEQLDIMMRRWIKKTDPGLSALLEMGWSEAYNELMRTRARWRGTPASDAGISCDGDFCAEDLSVYDGIMHSYDCSMGEDGEATNV